MKKLFLMAAVLGGMTLSSAAMADGHMKKIDTDGDGVISKSEFMAKHEEKSEERFDKIDADGDGVLSKKEMKKARGMMKKRMKERMAE